MIFRKYLEIKATEYMKLFGLFFFISPVSFANVKALPANLSEESRAPAKETVSSKDLIEAVRAGRLDLFDQLIKTLLEGSLSNWISVLFAVDHNGRNLFHEMALGEIRQKDFSERLQLLIKLLSPFSLKEVRILQKEVEETFGVTMSMTTSQFFNHKFPDQTKTISQAVKETSAVHILSNIHSPAPLLIFPGSSRAKYPLAVQLSFIDQWSWLPPPHIQRDNQGFKPVALADREGNVFAYRVLSKGSDYERERVKKGALYGTLGGTLIAAMDLTSFFMTGDFILLSPWQEKIAPGGVQFVPDKILLGAILVPLGGVSGLLAGPLGSKCYRAFKRYYKLGEKEIKRRIANKNIRTAI